MSSFIPLFDVGVSVSPSLIPRSETPLIPAAIYSERPYILPIYLSSPAFSLAAMSSYSVFCFLQHIRFSAFLGENGGLRDGLAETFWFYSQNLPTVALLLPRAGLSLALLFAFSAPQPGYVALADVGMTPRDHTYFRSDGSLTGFARGVLIANAAWTAWRLVVLITSWYESLYSLSLTCRERF